MTPELEEYIEQHISHQPESLEKIDRDTNLHHINGRMCSGHIQGRILKMLSAMIRPDKVLELGTFTGYSSLCIAEALEDGAVIHTVECDDELEETILSNFNSSPYGGKIQLHIGDAIKVIKDWEPESFDMVIIDADKREYPAYYEMVFPLLKHGGYILADNTLWDGHVTENHPRSSQTSGILEFNEILAHDPRVEVCILPVRDGLTIARKL